MPPGYDRLHPEKHSSSSLNVSPRTLDIYAALEFKIHLALNINSRQEKTAQLIPSHFHRNARIQSGQNPV